jgi:hypothetical protein
VSRYHGNHDKCPVCGLTYGEFRTGMSYREVFGFLMDNSDDPADWHNKSRHTVLGKWHELKKQWWAHHLEECAKQKEFEDAETGKGDAWEHPDDIDRAMEGVPF